jgi:predicted DNA-binding protein
MEVRPGHTPPTTQRAGRGSGASARKQRRDALGPRKDVMIRMPEDVAHRLKVVAAHERMTVTDYCLQVIIPHIDRDLEKHGLSAEQLAR